MSGTIIPDLPFKDYMETVKPVADKYDIRVIMLITPETSEERIRFMDAIAQDLSRTISMIDGVVDARVHVVLPENDPFAKNTLPSSAAVAIRSRWDVDLTESVPQVKSLVKNAIEGLSYEKITVTIFQDMPPKRN